MKKLILGLCLILPFFTLSCGYGTDNLFYSGNQVDNRIDYIHTITDFIPEGVENLDKYRFFVVTDVHMGSKKSATRSVEPLYDWLDEVKAKDPDNYPKFCLSLGDNVDHGYKQEYDIYCKFIDGIKEHGKMPVINVLGNHDLYNSGWEHYKSMCYPYCSLFKFNTKNFTWYAIDTGTGDIGIKQYNIIKKAFTEDKRQKIVLMHYPLNNSHIPGKEAVPLAIHDNTERALLTNLFSTTDVKAVLCGHLHQTQDGPGTSFKEFGNPSYCYEDNGWTLFEVDEEKGTVTKIPIDYIKSK